MVTDMQSRDGVKTTHTFTHMMELKPYIEEPLSNNAASLHFLSLDLRPRIRHDFILSNRDAVDEYWQTLEYCYAAADQKVASYAFPGSVVHEVISKSVFSGQFQNFSVLIPSIRFQANYILMP